MYVSSVRLFNFRNLANGTYQFPAGVACIVGENGQGKTNLIEAISLLSLTRSFRTSALEDLVAWQQQATSVFAKAHVGGEEREVGMSIEDGVRKSFIDGKPCDSVMTLLGVIKCITFSPTDLSLVKGPPLGRRRFFDRHVADLEPSSVKSYIEYQRALKHKNALLKSGTAKASELEAWNEILIPTATKIINLRAKLLRELEARLSIVSKKLFGDSGAITLKVRGPSAHLIEERAGEEVSVDEVRKQYVDAIPRELAKQGTSVGPHRDDVVPFLMGKDARAFASQGQSRSIVLALKLAVIELIETLSGDTPVVLLDDVDSELDETRRGAIFESIFSRPRQVLITATEYRFPEYLRPKIESVLYIKNGSLTG